MKIFTKSIFLFALLSSFTLSHANEELIAQADKLVGSGATFPYPVISAWAYAYHKAEGVEINYQSTGAGAGLKQISDRTVDFGVVDGISLEELNKLHVFQFPIIIGGIVPVVNIEGVTDGVLKLDGITLSQLYSGEIRFWDDPALISLNPGLSLPHSKVVPVWLSAGAGTTAVFTHYLSQVSPVWKHKVGEGKSVKFPLGIGGKGNEAVANYVARTKNSIGYLELSFAKQNKLSTVKLKNASGIFVAASLDSFSAAASSIVFPPDTGFFVWMTNTSNKEGWPIVGASFVLLAKENSESNKKVIRFFEWVFVNGDKKARELDYVPLNQELKDKIRGYWKANELN